MKTAYELAEILADMAKNSEDGTVTSTGRSLPTEGYLVGGTIPSLVYRNVGDVDRGEIAYWIGVNKPCVYYGVWVDKETNVVYFDASTFMNFERFAIPLAAERSEIAIWDIANGQEIRVEGNPHLEAWLDSE